MPSQRHIQLFSEPPKGDSDWNNIEKDVEDALQKNVQRVQQATNANQGGRRESVYLGGTGVAFMQITLATLQQDIPKSGPEMTDKQCPLSPSLLNFLADHHIASVLNNGTVSLQKLRDGAHLSFLETPIGIATLTLSRYPLGSQYSFFDSHWRKCRDFLWRAVEVIQQDDSEFEEDDDGCEVLYGRAGFLYALLYLRTMAAKQQGENEGENSVIKQDLESCKELLSHATLEIVIRSIIHRGRNGAKTYQFELSGNQSPSLMWTWHNKRYLGGAHGVVGILQMLLQCPFAMVEQYMPEIVRTIDWLVTCQDRVGNWPTRAPELHETTSGDHELVQWCHGAPAMLILLSTILRMSVTPGVMTELTERQQDRFVTSLQRGCALVYMRGMLYKGVGLCHGTAGSVYALLAASTVLDGPPTSQSSSPDPAKPHTYYHAPYFTQAVHLAHLATYVNSLTRKGEMRTPDHPWSLYEGMAGICCAWAEVLFRMRNSGKSGRSSCSGMPGYDDVV